MLFKDFKIGEQVFKNITNKKVCRVMYEAGSILYDKKDGFSYSQKASYLYKSKFSTYDFGFHFIKKEFKISRKDMGVLYSGKGFVEGIPFIKFHSNNTLYNVPDAGNFLWGLRASLNHAPLAYMLDMANKNEGGKDGLADQIAITDGYSHQIENNWKYVGRRESLIFKSKQNNEEKK